MKSVVNTLIFKIYKTVRSINKLYCCFTLIFVWPFVLACNNACAQADLFHSSNRFNPSNTIYHVYFMYDVNSIFPNKDWITVTGSNPDKTFTATKPLSSYTDVVYDYPLICDETNINTRIRFQWDEADNITIDEDEEVKGVLLSTPKDEDGPWEFDDIDTYVFIPSESSYCLEFYDADNNVYIASGTNHWFDLNTNNMARTTHTSNNIPTNFKRAYIDNLVIGVTNYIKIFGNFYSPTYYDNQHSYKFKIKKVKPIVLVHGIWSIPQKPSDKDSAFGMAKTNFPYISELKPVKVFDFPWDHSKNLYTHYCENNNDSLMSFVANTCSNYESKPIVLAHSLGGILTLKQIKNNINFLSRVGTIYFFATPSCGSDLANWKPKILKVSAGNVEHLKRGGRHVWNLINNIPDEFKLHNCIFYVGKKDAVVEKPSANLSGTLRLNKPTFFIDLDHTSIKDFQFPLSGEINKVFLNLKDDINN